MTASHTGMTMPQDKEKQTQKLLTLVMPVYNEGDAVLPVIATLFLTIRHPFTMVVVHDSPEDPTVATIEKLRAHFPDLHLVQNAWDNGVLNALKTGIRHSNTPYVGIWVSYHLDPFGIINDMMEQLENGCDLVSANRFTAATAAARGSYVKKLFSFCGNVAMNKLIGIPISDVTTSIKIYRKEMLESLNIESAAAGAWAVSSELAIKAAIAGYRLGEVPLATRNINLIHGITRFAVLKQLPMYLKWLFLGWKHRKSIKATAKANKGAQQR